MNAAIHANLSCKRADTTSQKDFDWFYKIHDFMDCSKEVESSNLHRVLTHHLFFIKRVVIPIFGHSYICENNKVINIKDDMEQNHVVADFRGKFLPSLTDYVSLISEDPMDEEVFNTFQEENSEYFDKNHDIRDFMLAPLSNTGIISSLWITHNTWMVGEILPKVFPNSIGQLEIRDHKAYSPSIMFNRMKYADWVQNGAGFPPSFNKIESYRKEKVKINENVSYDGSFRHMDVRLD